MRITTKKLIFFSYFFVIFILSRLSSFFPSPGSASWRIGRLGGVLVSLFWNLILWFSGAILGGYIIKLDQLLYVYFTQPEAPLSLEVKSLLKQKRNKEAWGLLRQRVGEQRLAFRSALFQVVWVVLAFFTLTSTNVIFGRTMVMAVGFHLLLDEWEAVLSGRDISWIFWQIKREITLKEQKGFLWIMTGVFAVLSILLI